MRAILVLLAILAMLLVSNSALDHEAEFDNGIDQILNDMADEDDERESKLNSAQTKSDADADEEDENEDEDEPYTAGKLSKAGTELKSQEDIDKFIKEVDDTPVVIGYFNTTTHKKDFNIFMQLADRDGDYYRYAYVTNKEIIEKKNYKGCAVIVHLPPKNATKEHDKLKARYPLPRIDDMVAFKTFVRTRSVPLLGDMTMRNEKVYRNTRLPVLTVFHSLEDEKYKKLYNYVVSRLRKLALKWRGEIVFNMASIAEYRRDMDQKYDMEDAYSEKNVLVGLRDGSMYYHMPEGEGGFSEKKVEEFIEDYKLGEIEGMEQFDSYLNKDEDDPTDDVITLEEAAAAAGQTVEKVEVEAEKKDKKKDGKKKGKKSSKSNKKKGKKVKKASIDDDDEDEDEDKYDTEVVTLSPLNAKDVLATKKADLFVQFHAPWCGQCLRFKPELKRVAAAFQHDGGMIIAEMDVTTNDVPPEFKTDTYPAFFHIKASDKKHPIPYTGKQDATEMINHLFKARSTPVGKSSAFFHAMNENKDRGTYEL